MHLNLIIKSYLYINQSIPANEDDICVETKINFHIYILNNIIEYFILNIQ